MTTEICECREAPEFRSTTWGGPVCSRCGKKMILSRRVGEIRKVIDHFELWKCVDDADGYNVSADNLATIIANQSSGGVSLIEGMTDEEFNRDRSAENPNVGELAPSKGKAVAPKAFDHAGTLDRVVAILKEFGLPPEGEVDQFEWLRERLGGVRGPCIPVTYCGLATSTHVPVGSDEDHCDLCGHPAQPFTASVAQAEPWTPPPAAERPDGFECLLWHRGRWRHVSWAAAHQGWMFGYASAQTIDAPDRLYAPLPPGTPESNFWQGEKS